MITLRENSRVSALRERFARNPASPTPPGGAEYVYIRNEHAPRFHFRRWFGFGLAGVAGFAALGVVLNYVWPPVPEAFAIVNFPPQYAAPPATAAERADRVEPAARAERAPVTASTVGTRPAPRRVTPAHPDTRVATTDTRAPSNRPAPGQRAAAPVRDSSVASAPVQQPVKEPTPPVDTATPPAPDTAPGWLVVSSRPWGNLVVDGKPFGATPQANVSLPPGMHKVEIRRDGYRPYITSIKIDARREARLTRVLLQPIAP